MDSNHQNMLFLLEMEQALQVNPTQSLSEFVVGFRQKTGDDKYELLNDQAILTQLYGCIVLPWERLRKRLPKKIMMTDMSPEEWGYYKIVNHPPKLALHRMDLRFFIRQLRNAISHDNVKVNKDRSITFRNQGGFAVRYKWEELQKLIKAISQTRAQ